MDEAKKTTTRSFITRKLDIKPSIQSLRMLELTFRVAGLILKGAIIQIKVLAPN